MNARTVKLLVRDSKDDQLHWTKKTNQTKQRKENFYAIVEYQEKCSIYAKFAKFLMLPGRLFMKFKCSSLSADIVFSWSKSTQKIKSKQHFLEKEQEQQQHNSYLKHLRHYKSSSIDKLNDCQSNRNAFNTENEKCVNKFERDFCDSLLSCQRLLLLFLLLLLLFNQRNFFNKIINMHKKKKKRKCQIKENIGNVLWPIKMRHNIYNISNLIRRNVTILITITITFCARNQRFALQTTTIKAKIANTRNFQIFPTLRTLLTINDYHDYDNDDDNDDDDNYNIEIDNNNNNKNTAIVYVTITLTITILRIIVVAIAAKQFVRNHFKLIRANRICSQIQQIQQNGYYVVVLYYHYHHYEKQQHQQQLQQYNYDDYGIWNRATAQHDKLYQINHRPTIIKLRAATIIIIIITTTIIITITNLTKPTLELKKSHQLLFNQNHYKYTKPEDNSQSSANRKYNDSRNDNGNGNSINNSNSISTNNNNKIIARLIETKRSIVSNNSNSNSNSCNNNSNKRFNINIYLAVRYDGAAWWRWLNLILRKLNLRLWCYWWLCWRLWWWSCWLLCLIVTRRSTTGITKTPSPATATTTPTAAAAAATTMPLTTTTTTVTTILQLKTFNLHKMLIIIVGLHLLCWCTHTHAIRLTNSVTKSSSGNKEQLYIGLIAPHTNFGKREYLRAIHTAVAGLNKTRGAKLTFFKDYQFEPRNIRFDMMSLTPSPTAILSTLCKEFLQFNVSAILYMMNNEQFGHSTASAQYFLQLAGYLGIPVISWNADNSGLERRASQSTLQLQLAPSIEHQSAAMLSILERYKWHQFSVVTSQIAGHDDFVQAVRERVAEMQEHFKFTILNAIVVTRTSDLMELVNSEARVMLLYATQTEAITILRAAEDLKLTGENYVWVVSQSVIEKKDAHPQFPIGMLGVHFDTSSAALMSEISNAIKIYGYGVEAYVQDPANRGKKLNTQSLSCEDEGRGRWDNGETFFRYLRNVSIEGDLNKPNIEFTADGDLKSAELKIMNLRPSANNKNLVWEEIGVWKSWETQKLDIRDIAWPGNSHAPPQGVPEKFHLKITFLEEAPYINLSPADPVSGKCLMDRGVLCRVAADHVMADIDVGQAHRNESFYQCCSGFCIDLLEKFAEELGFTYELVRVEDGRWGTLENGKWNGLIADLVNRKTDMVLTSLMINTEREAVVDFSEPFMETGIAIVVAKRTGIISPTAFLEPFDTASWMLVGIVAIQAATFMIFLFEWLSPSGYDMKLYLQNTNVTPYRFSLFRTYWLVWAVLFQAAVHVDSPRGFTSRFMTNVWALFAVVFLAIYTANLAAFMITREEFHEFSGLNDSRLVHPYSHKPSFKFGTIPYSHTDSTINKYFKEMHYYMKQHNKSSVADGVADVLSGNLDAFIYDGTVLDYLVAQDEDCRLMIVGSWYAMTGYGLAFSRNSKYVQMFNKRLLEFRANGDLERLRRYWMTGTCRPGKQEHKSSDPLALEQFLSAFLLLMAGILLAALLLLLEHIYFKYIRIRIAKKDGGHCCALISLSMGKSLTFRGAVFEATEILKKHRCNDPICDTHLWKVKHELDMTRLRVRQLEKALNKHGIKPPQLRLSSSSDLLNHHHLKERPPLLGNLSLAASAQDLYKWSYKTEIAEMETVL